MDKSQILKVIADNPALFEAVKEAVLAEFNLDTISLSKVETLDNQMLGEWVRAQIKGVECVEDAFKKIASFKSLPDQPGRRNEAR